jgi:hypothetical protein
MEDRPHNCADELDHVFTPERIAELESISAEIKAGGKTYTMAEVRNTLKTSEKHGSRITQADHLHIDDQLAATGWLNDISSIGASAPLE